LKRTPEIVYEENFLWRPYQQEHTGGHAWLKVLAMDHETGASAALIKYEAGYKAPRGVSSVCSDSLFISGELTDGNKLCRNGTYSYRPPRTGFGPIEARQDSLRFVITGGREERCSRVPVFIQDVNSGPWDAHPYLANVMQLRRLRQDKEAGCTIDWQVHSKVILARENTIVGHDHVMEVFCVEGENVDFNGDVEGFVIWRRGMYIHRSPFRSRDGHSVKTGGHLKLLVKSHSLEPYKPLEVTHGLPSTFKE